MSRYVNSKLRLAYFIVSDRQKVYVYARIVLNLKVVKVNKKEANQHVSK